MSVSAPPRPRASIWRYGWLIALLVCLSGGAFARESTPQPPPQYIIEYDSIHHPVEATGGMVVSQNATASRVGAEILRAGGNAVDAAVATAACGQSWRRRIYAGSPGRGAAHAGD